MSLLHYRVLGVLMFVAAIGKGESTAIFLGPTFNDRPDGAEGVSRASASAGVCRTLARALSGRGITTTVFEAREPTEERVARIAASGGGPYVGIGCLPAAGALRIRYPPLPPKVHRQKEGPIEDPAALARELMAADRAQEASQLASLLAERFRARLGVSKVDLRPSSGDYLLEKSPGAVVIVELPTRGAGRSGNLCDGERAVNAMADAIQDFLRRGH